MKKKKAHKDWQEKIAVFVAFHKIEHDDDVETEDDPYDCLEDLIGNIVLYELKKQREDLIEEIIEGIKEKLPKTIKTDMLEGSYGAGGDYELGRHDYRILVEGILDTLKQK